MHLSNGSQDLILRSVAVGPCRLQRVSKDGCKHNCSNTEYAAILRDGRTQARAAPQDEGWDMPREKAVAPARGEGQDAVAAVQSPGNIPPRLGGKNRCHRNARPNLPPKLAGSVHWRGCRRPLRDLPVTRSAH